MPVARANGKLSWVAPFSAVIGFVVWVSLPTGGSRGGGSVCQADPAHRHHRGLRPLRYQTYR
jgi:hypothetical protein